MVMYLGLFQNFSLKLALGIFLWIFISSALVFVAGMLGILQGTALFGLSVILVLLTIRNKTLPHLPSWKNVKSIWCNKTITKPENITRHTILYYDTGMRFQEQETQSIIIPRDFAWHTFTFSLPDQKINALRFDPPALKEAELQIRDIRIINGQGKTLQRIEPEDVKPLHQIWALSCSAGNMRTGRKRCCDYGNFQGRSENVLERKHGNSRANSQNCTS